MTVIEENQGALRLRIPLQGRDINEYTDASDHSYPITIELTDNTGASVFNTDSVQAWTRGTDGLFPNPNYPQADSINSVLNNLDPTKSPFNLKVYSKGHLENCSSLTITQGMILSHTVRYSNQKPYLLAGNIEQTDSATDQEAILGADVNAFLDSGEWGHNVRSYDEFDLEIANDIRFIYDFNGNGQVGAEDFSILVNSLNKEGCPVATPPNEAGCDGTVGTETVNTTINSDLSYNEKNVHVTSGGYINGSLIVTSCGNITIDSDGNVNGSAGTEDGNITMSADAHVNGDAITYNGTIHLTEDSDINGDAKTCPAGEIILEGDSAIHGDTYTPTGTVSVTAPAVVDGDSNVCQ